MCELQSRQGAGELANEGFVFVFVFLHLIVFLVLSLSLSLSDSSLLCVSCRSRQGAGEPANEGFVFVFFTSVFYCCCSLVFVFVFV